MFTSRAWRRLFNIRGLLVHKLILEFFSTFRFGEVMLDLDTTRALQFQLEGARHRLSWREFILALGLHTAEEMETAGFVLLGGVRFTAGRKIEDFISGGQFVAHLAEHFGLLTEERLQEGDAGGVTEEARVAPGGGDEDEEMPQSVPPPPRTQGERIVRLEKEVYGMREALQGQREVSVPYMRYSKSPVEYKRRTRCRTDGANTSITPQQPNP
nr:hypothetical protein [Tanacetum cinerariifolium]